MKRHIKILIIDDNPDDRALAFRELRREFPNIEVEEVIDADEFRKALQKDDFDLVITDYNIRWTDGLNVLEKVKKRCPDCPVIMFTGTGSEEIVVQAMKGGLDDYVVKTTTHFVRLPASVRSVLKSRDERLARQRAEELYERLFENIPIGLYCVKPNGEIIAVNEALVKMLKYPNRESLMDIKAEKIFTDPEERETWLNLLIEKGTVTNYENMLKTYEGDIIWIIENAHIIRDEEDKIAYIEGSLTDISERKAAKIELKTTKKKVEQLHTTANILANYETEQEVFDHAIGAAKDILGFDSSSILIYEEKDLVIRKSSNESLEEGTRYPLDRGIVGKTFREKKTFLIYDIIDQPEAKPAKKEYRSAVSAPIGDIGVFQIISNEVGHFDEYDKDLVDILVSHTFEALRRIRYQGELKESEKLYRSIIENSGTAMAIIEEDMTASMVNKKMEDLTGYTREELIGIKKWPEFVVEEDLDKLKKYHEMRRENTDSAPSSYTFKFINRYGDTKDVFAKVSMIPDTKKSILSLLDITHNLKTLKAFEESQEMFRVIFENSKQGMAILDVNGNISEVNNAFCEIIEQKDNELTDKQINDFISENEQKEFEKEIKAVVKGARKMCEAELTLTGNDGKTFTEHINISSVKDYEGKVRLMLAFINKRSTKESGKG